MLQIFSAILCFIMVITGIIGYSFEIPENYIGNENIYTSILVYYATLSAYLLVYAIYSHIKNYQLYVFLVIFQCFFALISAYGLYQASIRWNTKIENVKEVLLYLGVIYLLGKTQPFDEISKKIISEFTVIPILASITIILFTGFVILRFEQKNTPVFFEDFNLIKITFTITALVGLCYIGNGISVISCIVISILDFYVLSKLVKLAKTVF